MYTLLICNNAKFFWMIYNILYNNGMYIQTVNGDDMKLNIAVRYYHY
jgi:hypothetical protein